MNKKIKLKEQSLWLLRFMVKRLPLGFPPSGTLPSDRPLGIGLQTMRGLERRGFIRQDGNSMLFYATEEGQKALETIDELSAQ